LRIVQFSLATALTIRLPKTIRNCGSNEGAVEMRALFLIFALGVFACLTSGPARAQTTPTLEQCDEAWREVHAENTLAAYQGFLQFFSNCPEAEQARRAIEAWNDGTEAPARSTTRGPEEVAPPANSAVAFPQFPWPPPRPSEQTSLPRTRLLAAMRPQPSLYDVGEHLAGGLDRAGYSERSFYGVPNGFALVARLERILENGRPAPGGFRYIPPGHEPFSLTAYLSGLFVAPVGYYRQIVFVVTDAPFVATGEELTQRQASELLREGANRLPSYFRNMPFGPDYEVSALIYEFEKTGTTGQMRLLPNGRLGARTHLSRSGLYPVLVP
jgi:hypothetical protein